MPETADTHIGTRMRDIRKRRGMTQTGLARASRVSVSLIRKLEQGEVQETRLETARKLAHALRVPTTQLVQRDAPTADQDTTDRWALVRAALVAAPTEENEQPTPQGVSDALRAAEPLFERDRFAELAVLLPQLLRDADALDDNDSRARAAKIRLLQLTGWLLTQTRQYEAAGMALDRALAYSADRLDGAATINTLCWLRLRTGHLTEAREIAARWADEMEPRVSRATPDELSAWGWLMLRVSAAAVRDNLPVEGADALRMAQTAAVALGREHAPHADFLRTFGPVTVALKRGENASIEGRPDVVLRVADTIPSSRLRPTSNNRNRHLLDVADAHVKLRRYGESIEVLQGIYAASSEWLPQQRFARDIMSRLIGRRRTLTPAMRTLADVVGVPM